MDQLPSWKHGANYIARNMHEFRRSILNAWLIAIEINRLLWLARILRSPDWQSNTQLRFIKGQEMNEYILQLFYLTVILKLVFNTHNTIFLRGIKSSITQWPVFRLLTSIVGIDYVFRFLMSIFVFMAGIHRENSKLRVNLLVVSTKHELDLISDTIDYCRKIGRYLRIRICIKQTMRAIRNLWRPSMSILKVTDALFLFVADFLNLIFFITEIYAGLYVISIFPDSHTRELIRFYAHHLWFISFLCYFLRDITMLLLTTGEKHKGAVKSDKFIMYLVLDAVRNFIDTLVCLGVLWPGILQKETAGLIGMVLSPVYMMDFWCDWVPQTADFPTVES